MKIGTIQTINGYKGSYTDEKINGRTDKRKTVTFGKEK